MAKLCEGGGTEMQISLVQQKPGLSIKYLEASNVHVFQMYRTQGDHESCDECTECLRMSRKDRMIR